MGFGTGTYCHFHSASAYWQALLSAEGRHVCRRTSIMSPLMVTSTVTCPKSVAEFSPTRKRGKETRVAMLVSTYIVSTYDTQAT